MFNGLCPVRTDDFDYSLPPERIAQEPAPVRDRSRLLVLHRNKGKIEHRRFCQLGDYLRPEDVLVMNNSRVLAARVRALKTSGGRIELLLLEQVEPNLWWCLAKPGKRLRVGVDLQLFNPRGDLTGLTARVVEKTPDGHFQIQFDGEDILGKLDQLGEMPLPPYIRRTPFHPHLPDQERYQTVFAKEPGSIAAPTAGLHFTRPLLRAIQDRGTALAWVTLHVGWGTFAPIHAADPRNHVLHDERFELTASEASTIDSARRRGGRVVAVGTTTVRVLETIAAENQGRLRPAKGRTRLFLYPPAAFHAVDALITNFHLPRSSLLMLVSAFAAPGTVRGRDLILRAYEEAIREGYRFYSYGDAMLICN